MAASEPATRLMQARRWRRAESNSDSAVARGCSFRLQLRSFSIAAVAARSKSPDLGPLKVILIIWSPSAGTGRCRNESRAHGYSHPAMDQQFALPLASQLAASLDRLRLGVEDLAGSLPAFTQGAPLIAALNHVNILTVGHVGTPNKVDMKEFTNDTFKSQSVNQQVGAHDDRKPTEARPGGRWPLASGT